MEDAWWHVGCAAFLLPVTACNGSAILPSDLEEAPGNLKGTTLHIVPITCPLLRDYDAWLLAIEPEG